MQEILTTTYPTRTSILVAGAVSDSRTPYRMDLVVGGAIHEHHQWLSVLRQTYFLSFSGAMGCSSQVVRGLTPDRAALLEQCLNGGSDAESFVVVAGQPLGVDQPVMLLATSCGRTYATVTDDILTLQTAGLRGGYSDPGASQPTFTISFDGRSGELGVSDPVGFAKYCAPPNSYSGEGR
jgi:hypothetical protein